MTEHVGKQQQQQESSSNNNNTSETCTTPSAINIPKSQPEISATATVVSDESISNTEETAQNLVVSAPPPGDLKTTDENITEETNPSSVENTNNSSETLVLSEAENAPMESENTQLEAINAAAPTSVEDLSKDTKATDSTAMDVEPSTIPASAEPSCNLVETNQSSSVETTVTTTPSIPVSSNVPSTTINSSTCNNIPSTTVQSSETVESVTTSSVLYSEPGNTTVVPNSVQETTVTQEPMEEEVDHTQTFIVSHPESETPGVKSMPYTDGPIVLQPTRLVEKSPGKTVVDQSTTTRLVEQQRAVLAQTTTSASSRVQHQPVIATSSRPLAVKTVPMHPEFIGPGSTVIIHEDNVISIPEDGKTANNVISIPEDFQNKEDLASLVDEGSMVHNLKLEDQAGARIQVSQGYHLNIPTHLTLASGNTVLINQQQHNSNILAAAMAGNNISTTTTTGLDLGQMRLQEQKVKVEPTSLGMLKAPSTDVLLKTAKEVLQLQDDDPPPPQYRRVFHTQG